MTRTTRVFPATIVAVVLILSACGGGEAPEPAVTADEFLAAARGGDLEGVTRMVDAGTPVDLGDKYDSTALIVASDYGQIEVVRYLLGQGADTEHRETFFDTTALDRALWKERVDVATVLLEAGADQREDALEWALANGEMDLAAAAIAAGPMHQSRLMAMRTAEEVTPEVEALLATAESRPDSDPPTYSADELATFTGTYETWDAAAGSDVLYTVTAVEGGLAIARSGDEPVQVVPSGERAFRAADGSLDASFWGRAGSIESLTVAAGDEPPTRMRRAVAEPQGAEAFTYEEPEEADIAVVSNWPTFRGPDHLGVGDGADTPSSWNVATGEGVRWKVTIPGLGDSSPIVWGDRVYVTTAVAEGVEQGIRTGLTGAGEAVDEDVEHVWQVMAYDKTSGEPLWSTEIDRAVPKSKRHFKASQANSTPVTDGTHLVAVFPTAGMACLDLDGNVQWTVDLGRLNAGAPGDPGMEWGFASSPVLYDGVVIVQVDVHEGPYVAAWDLATGEQRWRVDRPDVDTSWGTPAIVRSDDGDELVLNGSVIHAYDPSSGESLWSLGPNSALTIATPVAGDGVVYVSAGYAPVKPIYAVRTGTRGDLEVEPGEDHEALAWSHGRGGAYMPTPLLYRGMFYVVHHNGRIVAYDAAEGTAIYKSRFSAGGTFTASPIAVNGKIYMPTEEGQVYVVEAGPEFTEVAVNDMAEPVMATPAVSDGVLFVRTPTTLYALGG